MAKLERLTCACGEDLTNQDIGDHFMCGGWMEVREMSLEELKQLYPEKKE